MRLTNLFASLAIMLGLCSGAFAVSADWAEEMNAHPTATGWANTTEGDWLSTVDETTDPGTWINTGNSGQIQYGANPLAVGVPTFTIEYRFRFLDVVSNGNNPSYPIWLYNTGNTAGSHNIGRVRSQFGNISDNAGDFEVPGAGDLPNGCANCERHNYFGAYTDWVPEQWYTARIVMEDNGDVPDINAGDTAANGRTRLYLDGVLVGFSHGLNYTSNSYVGQDDPWFAFGAGDNGSDTPVQWDYIRIKAGAALDPSVALGPVPEPACGLMALVAGGLMLATRRRAA